MLYFQKSFYFPTFFNTWSCCLLLKNLLFLSKAHEVGHPSPLKPAILQTQSAGWVLLQFFLVLNTLSTICNSIQVLPCECVRQYTWMCTDIASRIQCPFVSFVNLIPNHRDPNGWEIQTGLADVLIAYISCTCWSIWRNFPTAKNSSYYKIFQMWCSLTQCSSLVRENTRNYSDQMCILCIWYSVKFA